MIWLYLSWLILLIGAAIAYYHQHPDKIPDGQHLANLSNRMKEKIALLAIYHIGKRFHKNEEAWTANQLADQLNISSEALSEVLHTLECDRIITRHRDRAISYLPAQSLENIAVIRVLESIRNRNETSCVKNDYLCSENVIENLMDELDRAAQASLGKLSVKQLLEQTDANNERDTNAEPE